MPSFGGVEPISRPSRSATWGVEPLLRPAPDLHEEVVDLGAAHGEEEVGGLLPGDAGTEAVLAGENLHHPGCGGPARLEEVAGETGAGPLPHHTLERGHPRECRRPAARRPRP
jgi:hypothetical protein